jgi:hypothetical protein
MLFNWLKGIGAKKGSTYRHGTKRARLLLEALEDRWCPSTVAPPHVTVNPVSVTVDAGTPVTFTAAADVDAGVQWKVSVDGGAHFFNIWGATSDSLSFTARGWENGAELEAVFYNRAGKVTTSAATLTVDYAPWIIRQPYSHSVLAGGQVSLTAAAVSNPVASVQWQVSTDLGKTFSDVAGATSDTFSFTASTPGIFEYRAVFTNSVGTATTRVAFVRVDAPPVITANPADATAIPGQTVTFTAAATGFPGPYIYWQVSTDGGKTFHYIPGAHSATLTVAATLAMNGNEYRAVFFNWFGKATTSAATLTVAAGTAPMITTQPTSKSVTTGTTVTLTAAASGNPTPTVQWQVSHDGGVTFTDIAGATAPTYSFGATVAGVCEYRAVFKNSLGSATTAVATVTVTGKVITF